MEELEEQFLKKLKGKVSTTQYFNVCEKLNAEADTEDEKQQEKYMQHLEILNSLKFKKPILSFLFSVVLGFFGVDKFYQGFWVLGIVKTVLALITGGAVYAIMFTKWDFTILGNFIYVLWGISALSAFAFAIFYLVDIFMSLQNVKDQNYYKVIDSIEE